MSDAKPTVESLTRALAEAQAVIADQKARLKALGNGREQGMRALAAARAELEQVKRERDQLRQELKRVDGMQTATVALTEQDDAMVLPTMSATLPSIDELMAELGSIRESKGATAGHLHVQVTSPDEQPLEDMLAPALVFSDEDEGEASPSSASVSKDRTTRLLVLLDGEQPIKYPLYKSEMTIGRLDPADIKIDSHFISRLHARIVITAKGTSIEDVDSKNGIKVNGTLAKRHTLEHGDLVSLGGLHFRFLDTTAG